MQHERSDQSRSSLSCERSAGESAAGGLESAAHFPQKLVGYVVRSLGSYYSIMPNILEEILQSLL